MALDYTQRFRPESPEWEQARVLNDVLDELLAHKSTYASLAAMPDPKGGTALGADRNAQALRYFRSRLALRSTSACDILVVPGDSLTGGEGATAMTNRWTDRLRDRLRTAFPTTGVAGGYGHINPAGYLATTWTTPFTNYVQLSGSAARGGTQYGFGACVQMTTTGSITLSTSGLPSSIQNVTGVDILYVVGGGGSFTVQVDGGAASAAQSTAGSLGIAKYSVTGLSAATHSIVVNWSTSGNTIIAGFVLYNGDESTGIRMWNGGQGGYTLAQWMATSPLHHWEDMITYVQPALVLIPIGANEYKTAYNTAGMDPTSYQTNLAAAVALIRTKSPKTSICLVVEHALGGVTVQYPWSQYQAANYAVAAADGKVAVLDWYNRMGTQPNTDIPGILNTSDNGQHFTDLGNDFIAEAILGLIRP